MNKATLFWKWFLEHKDKLKNLVNLNPKEHKHYLFWLDWHLQFYFPGLEYILIFPKSKMKKVEMIISAKGKPELFAVAIGLEKDSPKLWDLKFTAVAKIEKGESNPFEKLEIQDWDISNFSIHFP